MVPRSLPRVALAAVAAVAAAAVATTATTVPTRGAAPCRAGASPPPHPPPPPPPPPLPRRRPTPARECFPALAPTCALTAHVDLAAVEACLPTRRAPGHWRGRRVLARLRRLVARTPFVGVDCCYAARRMDAIRRVLAKVTPLLHCPPPPRGVGTAAGGGGGGGAVGAPPPPPPLDAAEVAAVEAAAAAADAEAQAAEAEMVADAAADRVEAEGEAASAVAEAAAEAVATAVPAAAAPVRAVGPPRSTSLAPRAAAVASTAPAEAVLAGKLTVETPLTAPPMAQPVRTPAAIVWTPPPARQAAEERLALYTLSVTATATPEPLAIGAPTARNVIKVPGAAIRDRCCVAFEYKPLVPRPCCSNQCLDAVVLFNSLRFTMDVCCSERGNRSRYGQVCKPGQPWVLATGRGD